jgi:hypothetical protein
MANTKSTRSRKRKKAVPTSQSLRFPEVKGKVVETIEIDPALEVIFIMFQDKTALSFQLEPHLSLLPELSDWKTGSAEAIKEWDPVQSKPALAKWWS